MMDFTKNFNLSAKIALLGAVSVLITVCALIILATWQSTQYNNLAQSKVDALIDADLDHITLGTSYLVQTENDAVQQQLDVNLNVARHILKDTGEVTLADENVMWTAVDQFTNKRRSIQLPKMLVGGQWLGQNTSPAVKTAVIDDVVHWVGETSTLFQRMNKQGDMLRIATTVTTAQGKRAIGTYIPAVNPDGAPNPVISAILSGKTYHGRAFVVDAWYLTAYEPIKDRNGYLVGMLYVGVKQKTVESRIRKAILQTKVGRTGYVYVLGGKGEGRGRYVISLRGERDGEDVWKVKDSDSRYVIQEIINKAIALQPGELATVRYRWKNSDDAEPHWKVARIAYYAPWDWIIGASVNEEELQSYQKILTDGRYRMTGTMVTAGTIIITLMILLGIFTAMTIARPVREMTRAVETIVQGDLDQRVEVRSRDEVGALASAFNIMTAKLKSTIEGLHQSEAKYKSIFENAREGIYQSSLDGRYLSVNPAQARMLGYDSPEDLLGCLHDMRNELYVRPEDYDNYCAAVLEHGSVTGYEVQVYRKDKEKIWMSVSARLVQEEMRSSPFIEGVNIDITERKKLNESLKNSEKRLSEIINFLPDPTFAINLKGEVILWNRAAEEYTGKKAQDILGKGNSEISIPFYGIRRPMLIDLVLKSSKEVEELYPYIGRNGMIVTGEGYTQNIKRGAAYMFGVAGPLYDSSGAVIGAIESIRDITDRKKMEEEILRSQKMESIGLLAGGIAHDFNNLLTAILGNISLAKLSPRERILECLDAAEKASLGAKDLTQRLITFAKGGEPVLKTINLAEAIKTYTELSLSGSKTKCEFLIPDNLWSVKADKSQIGQVISNLVINADQAMPNGGVIRMTCENAVISEDNAAALKHGQYVKVVIQDQGMGISQEDIAKVFDPYFTTKEKGTGLGLATVYSIIKKHDGHINVESKVGLGTLFSFYLPASELQAAKSPSQEKEMKMDSGKGRVLIMDDEEIIRQVAGAMLNYFGYETDFAKDGTEAINKYVQAMQSKKSFDVVIMDLTIPGGMGGKETVQELINIDPNVKAIVSSGYSNDSILSNYRDYGFIGVVSKPYRVHELTDQVAKILQGQ